jgi:hypothetical protein
LSLGGAVEDAFDRHRAVAGDSANVSEGRASRAHGFHLGQDRLLSLIRDEALGVAVRNDVEAERTRAAAEDAPRSKVAFGVGRRSRRRSLPCPASFRLDHHIAKNDRIERALTKSQGFVVIHEIMTNCAPNFRLQFLDGDSTMMLVERPLSAADADDAAREAAFGDWPAGARLCRVTNLDGREVASVGRALPPRVRP